MRFLIGDDLNNIRSLTYNAKTRETTVDILSGSLRSEKGKGVQCLAISGSQLISVHADGTLSSRSILKDAGSAAVVEEYVVSKLSTGSRFIGLSATPSLVYACTSNGTLRRNPVSYSDGRKRDQQMSASLPTRLNAWRLSKNHDTFAYGGDEVDLSVWDAQRAFEVTETPMGSAKRKRGADSALFPGELWRAKNAGNDVHGLRSPIHITSLAYTSPTQIVTGTQNGSIRLYDTRTAKRPTSDWSKLARVGGIKCVEKGYNEHEIFVSDNGSNVYALDLRSGGILYAYKRISGAVTSIASSPNGIFCSISLDRYARIHSSVAPPDTMGFRIDQKGEILAKEYLRIQSTAIIWDQEIDGDVSLIESRGDDDDDDDDDVWQRLDVATEDRLAEPRQRKIQRV